MKGAGPALTLEKLRYGLAIPQDPLTLGVRERERNENWNDTGDRAVLVMPGGERRAGRQGAGNANTHEDIAKMQAITNKTKHCASIIQSNQEDANSQALDKIKKMKGQ